MKSIQFMFALLFLGFCSAKAKAQTLDSLHLKINVQNYNEGEPVFLAYYVGENKYLKDTLWLDENGEANYIASGINKGLYLLILNDQRFVEFLVAEERFSVYLNAAVKDLKPVFLHSIENSLLQQRNHVFLTKVAYEKSLVAKRNSLKKQFPDSIIDYTKENSQLDYWTSEADEINQQIVNKYPKGLISAVINAMVDPSISSEIPKKIKKQKLEKAFQLNQFKNNYFKNFDFENEALLYTPIYEQRVHKFLDVYTVQSSDSLIAAVDFVIEKSRQNEAFFRFTVSTILNKYAQVKLVCASQKVYAHVVKKYYSAGLATWASETEIKKMEESAQQMASTGCKAKMPELLFGFKEFILYPLDTSKAFTIVQFIGAANPNNETLVTQLNAYLSPKVKANVQVVLVLVDDITAYPNSDELKKRIPTNWTIVDGSAFKSKLNFTYNLGGNNTKLYLLNNQNVIQAHSLSANQVNNWVGLTLQKK